MSPGIVNLRGLGGGFLCPERSSIESRDSKFKGEGGSSVLRGEVLSRGIVNLRGGGSCVLRRVVLSRGFVNLRGGGSSALRGVVLSRGYVNLRGGGFLCPERSSIESRVCKLKGRGVPVS